MQLALKIRKLCSNVFKCPSQLQQLANLSHLPVPTFPWIGLCLGKYINGNTNFPLSCYVLASYCSWPRHLQTYREVCCTSRHIECQDSPLPVLLSNASHFVAVFKTNSGIFAFLVVHPSLQHSCFQTFFSFLYEDQIVRDAFT